MPRDALRGGVDTHKHTHTVCHEMMFVAVFACSLGIVAIFGWFLPTINQSGFSQVCLLPSLWDPLPARRRETCIPALHSRRFSLPSAGPPWRRDAETALPLCQRVQAWGWGSRWWHAGSGRTSSRVERAPCYVTPSNVESCWWCVVVWCCLGRQQGLCLTLRVAGGVWWYAVV